MTLGVVLGAWLNLVPAGGVGAFPVASQAASPSTSPLFAARSQLLDARAAYSRARWMGTLAEIKGAAARLDRASRAYKAVLRSAALPASIPAAQSSRWTPVALDLAEAEEWDKLLALLRGPLARARALLPLCAHALGRVESPTAGLIALGWPPDRRDPAEGPRLWDLIGRAPTAGDEAGLFVAASLSDSAGQRRAARAARWRLLEEGRPATARSWARASLAGLLAAEGESLLARAILEREPSRTITETILLAELTVAGGDSASGTRSLILPAASIDRPTRDRFACARRSGVWAQGPVADSLSEEEWRSLARALGDLGEAATGLRVVAARRVKPRDAAAAVERDQLQAWLLFKARKYEPAGAAYRSLLARSGADAKDRAEYALGMARSERGLHDFVQTDSSFALAAALDSTGATGETAAWERAREWEDRKTPEDAAGMLRWARPLLRSPSFATAGRVHEAIAWIRADSLALATAALEGPGPEDSAIWFWRGWLARTAGDSARATECYRRAWEADAWSYEGVRAREMAGLPVDPMQGTPGARSRHEARPASAAPASAPLLDLVGFHDLAIEQFSRCAGENDVPAANGCIDALESRGMFRVGRGDVTLDLRLRFPPAFAEAVFRAAEAESLDACFLWAIMRRESGYNPAARSRAGALGLLQLMRATASRLAGRSVPEDSLTDPELNVRLGGGYLRRLLNEFGDPRAAMAAYNAGEEAVRRWNAARETVDDLWVELIPFRETRDYVKQIYAAWRRYESVYEAAPSP